MATTFRQALNAGRAAALVALLLTAGCTEENEVGPRQPPPQTVNELVETTGWFPEIVPDSTAYTLARFDSTAAAGGGLECADFTGHQLKEVGRLTVLAADVAVHHAGAVLQYAHLDQVVPTAVTGERAGGDLVLTGPTGDTVVGEVAGMTGAAVAGWRAAHLGDLAPGAGTWTLAASVVRDVPQIALGAGVHPTALPAAVREDLLPRTTGPGRVLLRLQRTHHTVTAPYPGRAGRAFAPEVLGVDLADQMSEGNPPVWVESLHHGQLALVMIEATAAADTLVDACVNTFMAALTGGSEDAGRPRLHEFDDLSVAAHVLGGDAASLETAATTGPDALGDWFAAPVGDPAGLPAVAADLAALRNGGALSLGLETGFAYTLCEPYEPVFDEVLWSLDAADARIEQRAGGLRTDGDGEYFYRGGADIYTYARVTAVPDLRGVGATTLPDPQGEAPILLPDLAGGRPAIELYELGLPDGHIYSQLVFDAQPLLNRGYSLFVVLKMPERVRMEIVTDGPNVEVSRSNDLNYFLHGDTGFNARRNLLLGLLSREELVYRHHPYGVSALLLERPIGWHVLAYRFGLDGQGMSVWLDGEKLATANRDVSLSGFETGRVGPRWHLLDGISHAVIYVAEVVAYSGAGSDGQMTAETERLREKYGF
jgi:hypothetical protein